MPLSSTAHRLLSSALIAMLSSVSLQSHAANWTLLPGGTVFDLSDQTLDVGGQPHGQAVFGQLQDFSTSLTWLHTAAGSHTEATAAGLLELGQEGTVSVDASNGASAGLLLSATQYLTLDATGAAPVSSIRWTQDVATTGVQLQIDGSAGELLGQRVKVSFEGMANLLYGGGMVDVAGESQIDLSFTLNGQVLSSLSIHGSGTFEQALNLSFDAEIGDVIEVTLAAHQTLSQAGAVPLPASQTFSLDRSAFLQGTLHVTAVPEPDLAWMALAGGLVMWPCVRARRRRTPSRLP